jgi:glyoxalase family protein
LPTSVPGIHHVTCITGDVQKCVNFYVGVLGLRFVKKSINQDMPDTYHIYFGDYLGTPGTAMTFFGWPSWPKRRAGSGQVTTVSFAVPLGSLDFWSERLETFHVDARRTSRFGTEAIVLSDPDAIELELVAGSSDERWVPWRDSPVDLEHSIRGFHSVTLTVAETAATIDLLTRTMQFRIAAAKAIARASRPGPAARTPRSMSSNRLRVLSGESPWGRCTTSPGGRRTLRRRLPGGRRWSKPDATSRQ